MYTFIYGDNGEIEAYMNDLRKRAPSDKQAKAQLKKVNYIMGRVENEGPETPENLFKGPFKGDENDDLYEIRANDERVFCCLWDGRNYILLSHYTKKSNKTDPLELARARRLRDEHYRRHPVRKPPEQTPAEIRAQMRNKKGR